MLFIPNLLLIYLKIQDGTILLQVPKINNWFGKKEQDVKLCKEHVIEQVMNIHVKLEIKDVVLIILLWGTVTMVMILLLDVLTFKDMVMLIVKVLPNLLHRLPLWEDLLALIQDAGMLNLKINIKVKFHQLVIKVNVLIMFCKL